MCVIGYTKVFTQRPAMRVRGAKLIRDLPSIAQQLNGCSFCVCVPDVVETGVVGKISKSRNSASSSASSSSSKSAEPAEEDEDLKVITQIAIRRGLPQTLRLVADAVERGK